MSFICRGEDLLQVIVITTKLARIFFMVAMITIMTIMIGCVSAEENQITGYNTVIVPQPGQVIKDDLTIVDITEFYSGPARGYSIVSLGEKVAFSGPGWMVIKPTRTYILSGHSYKHGQKMDRIPDGAMPVNLFFSVHQLGGKPGDYYFGNSLSSLFSSGGH